MDTAGFKPMTFYLQEHVLPDTQKLDYILAIFISYPLGHLLDALANKPGQKIV